MATFGGTLPAAAQTRRAPATAKTQTAAAPAKKAPACTSAWTGAVTYTRTQSDRRSKTVPRVSARGEDTTGWQMSYNYRATVAVVESPDKNGSSVGRASINHAFNSSETVAAKERNSCDRGKTWQNVTETITWSLQKCGAPLRLVAMKFEQRKFPNFDDWQEVTEQVGTVDGNMVKIKATVLNASGETKYADVKFKETYKGDKWDGARADAPLGDSTVSVRLEPGEEREVEMVWDSSGYAWFDDGRPRLVQRIKAELEENGKKADELTKNLKVAPKPLVLVHGLWSNWRAWESWQNILTTTHSYGWKAFPVGERADKGLMNTGGEFLSTGPTAGIFENSQQVGKYIRYAQEDRNAWHVDVVAHSMGGLIARHYVHAFMPPSPDGRPQVAHLVMLGTPNMGSPCAESAVWKIRDHAVSKNVHTGPCIRPAPSLLGVLRLSWQLGGKV